VGSYAGFQRAPKKCLLKGTPPDAKRCFKEISQDHRWEEERKDRLLLNEGEKLRYTHWTIAEGCPTYDFERKEWARHLGRLRLASVAEAFQLAGKGDSPY